MTLRSGLIVTHHQIVVGMRDWVLCLLCACQVLILLPKRQSFFGKVHQSVMPKRQSLWHEK